MLLVFFLAMQMAQKLSDEKQLGEQLILLNHRNFAEVKATLDAKMETYFEMAVQDIDHALSQLYGESYMVTISLQQLSATFRCADLMEKIFQAA